MGGAYYPSMIFGQNLINLLQTSLPIAIGVVNLSVFYFSPSFSIGFICMIVIDMILVNFLAVFVYYNIVF